MLNSTKSYCCKKKYFVTTDKQNVEYKEHCKICKTTERLIIKDKKLKGDKAVNKLKSLLNLGQIIPIENLFEKMPKEKTSLSFIPLQYFESIGSTQKGMYGNNMPTGFEVCTPIKLTSLTA